MIDGESQTTNNHVVLKFLKTSSSQIKRTYPVKSDELKRRAQKNLRCPEPSKSFQPAGFR